MCSHHRDQQSWCEWVGSSNRQPCASVYPNKQHPSPAQRALVNSFAPLYIRGRDVRREASAPSNQLWQLLFRRLLLKAGRQACTLKEMNACLSLAHTKTHTSAWLSSTVLHSFHVKHPPLLALHFTPLWIIVLITQMPRSYQDVPGPRSCSRKRVQPPLPENSDLYAAKEEVVMFVIIYHCADMMLCLVWDKRWGQDECENETEGSTKARAEKRKALLHTVTCKRHDFLSIACQMIP